MRISAGLSHTTWRFPSGAPSACGASWSSRESRRSNIETKAFGKEQNLDAATVKQLTEQNPNLTPEDRKRVERQSSQFRAGQQSPGGYCPQHDGEKSLQYYPYNAEDLKVLLGAPPKAKAAPRKAKAKVKK